MATVLRTHDTDVEWKQTPDLQTIVSFQANKDGVLDEGGSSRSGENSIKMRTGKLSLQLWQEENWCLCGRGKVQSKQGE